MISSILTNVRPWMAPALTGAILFGSPIYAFYGLYLPAYGARQAGMGGASTAVGGSVMSLENNPAGLSFMGNEALFEGGLAANRAMIQYKDRTASPASGFAFSGEEKFQALAPMPYLGAASPLSEHLHAGAALYVQGGGGAAMDGVYRATPNESREAGSNPPAIASEGAVFRLVVAKAALGVAWKQGQLAWGVGVDAAYAKNTMDRDIREPVTRRELPGSIHYQSATALAPGGRAGVLWSASERWRLGYSYSLPTSLPLNGSLSVDTTDMLRFGSADVHRRLVWPARHTVGASFRASQLTLACDIHYISWSRSFDTMEFKMDRPVVMTPSGVASPLLVWNLRWRDQTVIALGSEYVMGDHRLRFGYGYGRNPIPPSGLNPFLGATTEHHVSGGYGIRSRDTEYNAAVTYAFPNAVNSAPNADWAVSRIVQGSAFAFSRSMRVWTVTFGIRIWRDPSAG